MNAKIKLRLNGLQRRSLELIVSRRRGSNTGFKLSDAGREAIAEYIERHWRALT